MVPVLSAPAHDLAALRRHRLFQSADLDFTREQISSVLQPHRLQPHGSGLSDTCYLDLLPVGNTSIGAIRFGEMQVHVPELADYHLFIMCLQGQGQAIIERKSFRIDGFHGVMVAPGEQMLASFSPDCEQLFVRLGRETVAEHSGFRQLQFRPDVDLHSPRLGPWLRHLSLLTSDHDMTSLIETEPRIALEYERLLLSFLLSGQDHRDLADRAGGIAPSSVRRAEEYIRSSYAEPLSLADIADAAGVPTRTLLDSFRRFRDTSPIRYLRDVRLDAARDALRGGAAVTAAQAAMDAGIMHLGRFSQDYHDRFGERPSDTIRSCRHGRA